MDFTPPQGHRRGKRLREITLAHQLPSTSVSETSVMENLLKGPKYLGIQYTESRIVSEPQCLRVTSAEEHLISSQNMPAPLKVLVGAGL